MASVKREFSDAFLRDLHLLQYTAIVPKLTNIIALKKRLGIPLNKEEIEKELTNPRSPFYKYILDMIAACLILMEITAEINHLQQAQENMRREYIKELVSLEERIREISGAFQFSFDEKQNYEKRLQELTIVAAIVARKYDELKFWLQFFKSDDHKEARRIIDERYKLIYKNLTHFNILLRRTDLTSEERERIEEYYDQYQRHLELSTPENKQKYIGQYLQRDAQGKFVDNVMAMQALRKDATSEKLFERFLKGILTEHHKQEGLERVEGQSNIQSDDKTQKEITSKYKKQKNNKWQYLQLADELNNKLEKFFTKNEDGVIISFNKIEQLLDLLHLAKHKRDEAAHHNLDSHVDDTLHSLLIHDSDLDVTQFLKNWVEQKLRSTQSQSVEQKIPENFLSEKKEAALQHIIISEKEHAEFLQNLQEAKDDPELAEDLTKLNEIEEAYKKISDSKLKDDSQSEKIISSFNSLAEKYPDNQNITKLFENLNKFTSFIDTKELKEIDDSGYNLV